MSILDDHSFALLLTHDVDRVYKTYQSLYYAATLRNPQSMLDVLPWRNPYWQFESVMRIEADLGVRSSFNFLNERPLSDRPPRDWISPSAWRLYAGRYDIESPEIVDVIRELDAGGWEIGLHGSYDSFNNEERLQMEKATLENIVGHPILGGRQHYLNLEETRTWEIQSSIGVRYDSSLGSSTTYGFEGRYRPLRPFDDDFVVFPLTLMEKALPSVESDPELAMEACVELLEEARDHNAVMTVLWHPSYFYDGDHPNYGAVYRRLIERAQEMVAWVGPPGEMYRSLDHPSDTNEIVDTARRKEMEGQ